MADDRDNSAVIARILHGARWATFIRLGAQLISWGSTFVVVRFVSSADYGLNSMLEAPLELLFLLSTLGLDLALVRSRTLAPELIRPVFGWLLLINGGLSCAYFFGSAHIAAYFGEPGLKPLAQALAFLFLLVPFRVIPNAMLDRELKFKLRAAVELVCSVCSAATSMTLAVLGFGVWALVAGVLVSRVLSALLLMVLQPWIALPSLRLDAVRGMLALGGTLTLASALAITAGMFAVLIGGPAIGAAQLGLYTVALQFAMLPLSKVMPIVNSIVFPAFSKFEGQPVAIGNYTAISLGTGSLLLLPVMAGLACSSPAFAAGVLGPQWAPAAVPLAVLSLVMPIRGVGLFLRQVANGIGRADISLRCTAVIWCVSLASVLVGARFGIDGLVAAFAFTEVVGGTTTWLLVRRAMQLPTRTLVAAFRAPVVATLMMAATVLWCGLLLEGRAPLLILAGQVGVGTLTYLAVLRLWFWPDAQRLIALIKG
jgi:O-antigen/teichoic acid export membrane protein